MIDKVQLGAVGVHLKFPITDQDNKPLDVSQATTLNLVFKKPDGSIVVKTAALVNTGTDGLVEYVTEAGFLDQVKTWRVQCEIVDPNINNIDLPTEIGEFTVGGNLRPRP